jgi:benzoyl-CoA reductase/2-hydroxyglutaryl-CoA dehydratase subunit BcrC/BadD/HgdB
MMAVRRGSRIGITTTVPLEPFFASGSVPVDLNNAFIGSAEPSVLVEDAQVAGYPRNICTWIKGLYTAAGSVDAVVGVVRGDCSNTESLLETLKVKKMRTHPFSYPPNRDKKALEEEVKALCEFLGPSYYDASKEHPRILELRKLAWTVDRLLQEGKVSATDAHLALVSTSDFLSDPHTWEKAVREVIKASEGETPPKEGPRLGYIGVPPIITDLYDRIETMGGNTVFMEVQRQFSMPFPEEDWIGAYLKYTYPYSIEDRLIDIKREIRIRKIEGIVHYVQSFCHRQIDDMIFRSELDVPILTVEGNIPGPMDERTAIRVEAFLDILSPKA